MWSPVQILLKPARGAAAQPQPTPVVVPLRKSGPNFSDIIEGSQITFSTDCPLPQLSGQTGRIEKIRQYKFGDDEITTFRLGVGAKHTFSFSVAQDDQGQYLAISRLLTAAEQDQWFGNDALSFFTEPSTAKTIRCKADAREADWASGRYTKTVDWLEGLVSEGKLQLAFRYNLLVNETGEKALEIEHYPTLKKNQFYATVYRPIEDIVRISEPLEMPDAPDLVAKPYTGYTEPKPEPTKPVEVMELTEILPEAPKPKTDFRRISDPQEPIHIPATAAPIASKPQPAAQAESNPPLPSFLLSREHNYLSLDAVIAPDAERVRCGLITAKALIDTALQRGVRTRDILRELIGLDSMLSEEVILELPLSDADYRQLAMRYKMRPDSRDQIRAKMQEELRAKLLRIG